MSAEIEHNESRQSGVPHLDWRELALELGQQVGRCLANQDATAKSCAPLTNRDMRGTHDSTGGVTLPR